MKRILTTIAVVALMIGCTNPVSNNNDTDRPNVGSTDFYITGKVTNNGTPVKGASVRLMKSGLTAVSKDDGSYVISGKASTAGLQKAALSKTATRINNENAAADVSTYGDTLVITVAHPNKPNDSSEVVKTPVTSGVIMDLPATYIVQREIRGYLSAEDKATVGKIQALVYDNSVPDQIKTIDLWHDEVNDAFSSFAYFSSETNKNYTLYVKIYDVDGKFIGQSPDFSFPDNAGNIVFKNPFSIINAKPTLKVVAPVTVSTNSKAKINVAAVDSFGGQIVKCEIDLGKTGNYVPVQGTTTLNKRSAITSGTTSINDTVVISAPSKDTTLVGSIKVTDNDGNVSTQDFQVAVKTPNITGTVQFFDANNVQVYMTLFEKTDSQTVTLKAKVSISDAALTPVSYEWQTVDTINGTWSTPSASNVYQVKPSDLAAKMTGVTLATRGSNNEMTVIPVMTRVTLSNSTTYTMYSEILLQ